MRRELIGLLPRRVEIGGREFGSHGALRGVTAEIPVGQPARAPEFPEVTEPDILPASGGDEQSHRVTKETAAERRERLLEPEAATLLEAACENQMPCPILQLGENLQADRIGRRLVDIGQPEELRACGVGMLWKKFAGLRARTVAVVHDILDERMRAGEQPRDALLLVNDPAFDAELAELRAAGRQRIFQRAKERRVGESVERHAGNFAHQAFGFERPYRGGPTAECLQQATDLRGDQTALHLGAGSRALAHDDAAAPDFHPVVAGVQQLEAHHFCPERRLQTQAESCMRQTEIAAMPSLNIFARQAEEAEIGDVIDHRANVGEYRAGLRDEPAADPHRLTREGPLRGLLDIENVGVVFVHGMGHELRCSAMGSASPAALRVRQLRWPSPGGEVTIGRRRSGR